MKDSIQTEQELLRKALIRFNSKLFALMLGVTFGLAIFIVTNWVIIEGGEVSSDGEQVLGPHLQMLDQIFIGYRVSFWGSIVGFLYGFSFGTIIGSAIGWIYNRLVDLRH